MNIIKLVLAALLTSVVVTVSADDMEAINAALNKVMPGVTPDRIVESAISGLYEVSYGPDVFYVTRDGRYMFEGDLVNTATKENLTESRRAIARRQLIAALDPADMIIFAPHQIKHTVTVFTDVDCAFCRKLHSQIAEYNKYGIAVRYLAFPRSGLNTESYFKAVSVWCSADRRAAITRAKRGENLPVKTCNNPVKSQMELGERMGVTGTPSMVLEDGTLFPGYVPPEQLNKMVEQLAAAKP